MDCSNTPKIKSLNLEQIKNIQMQNIISNSKNMSFFKVLKSIQEFIESDTWNCIPHDKNAYKMYVSYLSQVLGSSDFIIMKDGKFIHDPNNRGEKMTTVEKSTMEYLDSQKSNGWKIEGGYYMIHSGSSTGIPMTYLSYCSLIYPEPVVPSNPTTVTPPNVTPGDTVYVYGTSIYDSNPTSAQFTLANNIESLSVFMTGSGKISDGVSGNSWFSFTVPTVQYKGSYQVYYTGYSNINGTTNPSINFV